MAVFFLIQLLVYGSDPPGTKYGYEDEVRFFLYYDGYSESLTDIFNQYLDPSMVRSYFPWLHFERLKAGKLFLRIQE